MTKLRPLGTLAATALAVTLVFPNLRAFAAVDLARFEAQPVVSEDQAYVHVEWETASEVDMLGFYLQRAVELDGAYEPISELIFAEGGVTGAVYDHDDRQVTVGNTYYYRLEAVETGGQVDVHGPISVTVASSQTATPTFTPTPTLTPTPSATATPSDTPTPTSTPSPTPTTRRWFPFTTPTPRPSATPSSSPTASPRPTATSAAIPTLAPTATETPAPSPSPTPIPSPSPSPSATAKPSGELPRTPELTATLEPASVTPTPRPPSATATTYVDWSSPDPRLSTSSPTVIALVLTAEPTVAPSSTYTPPPRSTAPDSSRLWGLGPAPVVLALVLAVAGVGLMLLGAYRLSDRTGSGE